MEEPKKTTGSTRRKSNSGSSMLKEIALAAGCAVSTVSRVINGNRKNFSVRPELEQKILELARQAEYQPNPFLQHMRTKNPKIVAIFDPLRSLSVQNQQAKSGFIAKLKNYGYMTIGSYVDIHRLHDYTVPFPISGALLFEISDKSFLSFFEKRQTPYAVINGLAFANGSAVQIDEALHAQWLIDLLHGKGHRRIVYYSAHKDAGTASQHYSGLLRQQSFLNELKQKCLPIPDCDGDALHSPLQFLEHHVLLNRATAVVCYDYSRVQQIYQAAWKLQLHIPEDFSVVCCDDDNSLQLMAPPVSGCTISGYELGESAAQLLLERLHAVSSHPESRALCAGKLSLRQSVRSVPL